jgi:uncharacterized OB-fold protein
LEYKENKMKVRGKDLKKEDFERTIKIEYHPELLYAWDAGYAVGKFLQGLKEGKILGIRCRKCDRILVPPRAFCELCFVPLDEWVELKDTGRVNTFSISYISWDVRRLEKPEIPAVIEIDGASPGIGILHLLGEVKPEEVKVGMKVKAVWKKESERIGAITDILYFKPLKGEE